MEETVLEWNGMEEGKETRKKLKIEKQAKETEEKANKIKENEKSIAERKRRQSNLDKAKLEGFKKKGRPEISKGGRKGSEKQEKRGGEKKKDRSMTGEGKNQEKCIEEKNREAKLSHLIYKN